MESQLRTRKAGASFVAGVTIGLFVASGAMYAHFSGFLTPLYHAVGLHSMAVLSEQHERADHAAMGHTGHGGMVMPPQQPAERESIRHAGFGSEKTL